jgi:hypothetical protein
MNCVWVPSGDVPAALMGRMLMSLDPLSMFYNNNNTISQH